MKKLLFVLSLVAITAAPALAFHDEGVAHCNGCHTMHNSQDGALVDPDSPGGNAWLLNDSTPSDTCLGCHYGGGGGYHVFSDDLMAPTQERGAGDFVFILEDNINDGHAGGANPIAGSRAGHNINAPGYGIGPDNLISQAPGGTFPSGLLGCSSCHDPHGNENFRFLNGVGPVMDGLATFTAAAPVADGLALFGGGVEENDNHTAYISGMSAWCGNCHGDFHNNNTLLIHPSGSTLGGTIATTYSLYNGTVDQTGGGTYLAEVPFQDLAMTTSSTANPTAGSQVMCMTCHRSHATSGPDAGRWDFSVTFLHEDGVESGSWPIPDPYANLNQRSLCNKCHNKDAGDHNPF